MLARWNPAPDANIARIQDGQKQILKDNIFNLYYEICNNQQAVNLYKEILHIIALAEYPWPSLGQLI